MTDEDLKYIGDDFEEEDETTSEVDEELEGLYDLVLPPGVPHKVIMEAMDKFNVEATTRECAVKTVELDKDNLLVLRGELESVNSAGEYIYNKMKEMYNYK